MQSRHWPFWRAVLRDSLTVTVKEQDWSVITCNAMMRTSLQGSGISDASKRSIMTQTKASSTSSNDAPPVTRQHKIVVIGAGMAGIRLAHSLLTPQSDDDNDDTPSFDITILEANDYIGGRISSQQFQGYTVERGANWISGLDNVYQNPIWNLARNVQLQTIPTTRDTESSVLALDATTGKNVTEEYIQTVQQFDDVYERAVETCARRGITPQTDVDVATLLCESGWNSPNDLTHIQQTVQYNVLDVWVANNLSNLSAAHDMRPGMNDVELGKEEVFVQDERGFNTILHDMVHDIQQHGGTIHLNTEVQRVDYTPGQVQVTVKNVETGSVTHYPADAVVCTVSLGVLQKNKIFFSPPLPEWKQTALHEIGMFCFAKVFCKFHDSFRPAKNQFAICSNKRGHYPFWMKYTNACENLFMCHLGGTEAERVESLTEEEIKNEIEEHFQKAFGQKELGSSSSSGNANKDASIFRPTTVAVTDWSTNPRFCGSYSYFPVHAFAKVPESDLTCGLTGTDNREGVKTLYFAGEGFDDKFNGWVQGAYRSGERVAESILSDIRGQSCS